jgi:serine protease AprX
VDNGNNQRVKDGDGHGTHVAGIIDGRSTDGRYIGVAPDANILSLAIADDSGAARETDLLRGLQWVYDHRVERNIRAANISMAASVPTSYTTSPVDAAVEQLWRGGVVVVTSAGNKGSDADATWYAPGNDPLVVTVGALDNNETAAFGDDTLAFFSSRGFTQDGVYKPDIVAPGRRIASVLSHPDALIAKVLPDHVTPDRHYIRLSGTSMAAPMVAGAAALIFERFPALNPDQVKGLLVGSARRYSGQSDAAGALDVSRAMQSAAAGAFTPANRTGLPLAIGSMPSGAFNSDLSMTSAYWNSAYWNSAYWNSAYWNSAYWNAVDTED